MNLAKLEHARESARLVREAFLFEMKRHNVVKHAGKKYGYGEGGEHGKWISGPFKEHWPESVKAEIRELNAQHNKITDRALAEYRKSGLRTHYSMWKSAVLGQEDPHLAPALRKRYERIARGEEPSDISRGQSQLARAHGKHLDERIRASRHERGENPRVSHALKARMNKVLGKR